MSATPLIVDLKRIFDQDGAWSSVIRALNHDKIIWKSLEEPVFRQKAMGSLPHETQSWSPAAISLLTIENPPTIEILVEDPLQPLQPSLLDQADRVVSERSQSRNFENISLQQACLMALLIREHRQQDGDWRIIKEIFNLEGNGIYCVFACLFGMAPDKYELLKHLNQLQDNTWKCSLALHALLSNPLPEPVLIDYLQTIFAEVTPGSRLICLHELAHHRPLLARSLAEFHLDTYPDESNRSIITNFQSMNKAIYNAELLGIADDSQALHNSLREIENLTQRIQADFAAELALSHSDFRTNQALAKNSVLASQDHTTDSIDYWRKAIEHAPEEPYFIAAYALALIKTGQLEEAKAILSSNIGLGTNTKSNKNSEGHIVDQLETQNDSLIELTTDYQYPPLLIVAAVLAFELGKLDDAGLLAKSAVDLYENRKVSGPTFRSINFDFYLAELLSNLKQHSEVIRLVNDTSGDLLFDPAMSLVLAKSYILYGQPKEALTPLFFTLSQQPDLLDVHQLLIASAELSGEWEAAFRERQHLINKSGTPTKEDLHNLAYCALNANKPETTINICQNLLESNSGHSVTDREFGVTYWLLGEAEIENQDSQRGLEHLYLAQEHDPGIPFTWIAISRYFSQLNEDIQAEEILRKASHSLPNSPEIQYEIGKLYLVFNLPAKAFPALRRAKSLLDGVGKASSEDDQLNFTATSWSRDRIKDKVLHNLGKTLRILGNIEEAKHIFEEAFDSYSISAPDDLDSLYDYAQTLLLLGYSDRAIPLLEDIVMSQKFNNNARLDLAKALLQSDDKPYDNQRVISLLEGITAITDPSIQDTRNTTDVDGEFLIEAEALLAESYNESGNFQKAADTYKHALESPMAIQPNWKTRLTLGLGSVALELGEKEKAIAALQDGVKYDPKNVPLLQKLADAYLASGLVDNSYQTAYSAYQLNPSDLDTITWFADHCSEIDKKTNGAHKLAKGMSIQALERATSISPSRADLYLRRGNAQIKDHDPNGAKASFMKVASISNPRWEELYQAAVKLRILGDFNQAIRIFDLAVQRSTEFDIKEIEAEELYVKYAETHIENSNPDAALRVLDQGIAFYPDSVNLLLEKTKLLVNLNRQREALDYLYGVLQNNPKEAGLHLRASELQLINGNITPAINHADQAMAIYSHSNDDSGFSSAARQAAELAFVQLQLDRARSLLGSSTPEDAPNGNEYLTVEIDLFENDDVAPLNDIITIGSQPTDTPRRQATKLRLYARREGIGTALSSVDNRPYIETLSVNENSSIFEYVAVGMAALDLGKWEIALKIFRQAVKQYPFALIVHYTLARAYVICAETQRICMAAEITTHSPGVNVISQETYQAFEAATEQIERQLDFTNEVGAQSDFIIGKPLPKDSLKEKNSCYSSEVFERLNRLKARGKAAFQPNAEAVEALRSIIINGSEQPEIIGAWILAQGASIDQEIIDKLSDSDPVHPLIWLYLSIAQSFESPELAIKYAEISLTHSINHPHAWAYEAPVLYGILAKLALRVGDFNKSQNYIQSALDFWPDEPRWHSLAADVDLMLPTPDLDSARDHLNKAIQIDPTNTALYLALGDILITNDNAQQALQLLQSAKRIVPEDPGVWLQLARAHQITDDLEQAISCVEYTIEHISDSNDPLFAQAFILHGEIALQSGNPREAVDRAKTLLHLFPDNGSAYALLSQAYEALNQSFKALVALEKAIELTSDPYVLELDSLRLVHKIEGIDSAINKSFELIDKYPHSPQLTAHSADLLMQAGKWGEAILAAREALRTNSGELGITDQAHLNFLIGQLLGQEGQLDQAIFHLGQAIQLAPSLVDPYLELGRVHLQRREFDQAMKIYKRAMENGPNDPRPFYHAGMALKENGEYIQAEAMLRRATKLAPNDIGIHRMHGAVVVLNLVHNRRDISLNPEN